MHQKNYPASEILMYFIYKIPVQDDGFGDPDKIIGQLFFKGF
jgi:hypothetical protein